MIGKFAFPDKSAAVAAPANPGATAPDPVKLPSATQQPASQPAPPKRATVDDSEFPLEFCELECTNKPMILGKTDHSDVQRRDTFTFQIADDHETVTVEKIQFCVRAAFEDKFTLNPGVPTALERHASSNSPYAVFDDLPKEGDCITLRDAFTNHGGTQSAPMTFHFYWLEHVYDRMPEAKTKMITVWGNFVIVLADGRKLKSHRVYMVLAP